MTKSIHVNIEKPETWNRFREYVENKHGKLHTVMGQELEKAILLYLADQAKPHGHAHTHQDEPEVSKSSKSSSKAKFEDMTQQFLAQTKDTDSFQKFYAERLVKENFGMDPRTIEKYTTELENAWNKYLS